MIEALLLGVYIGVHIRPPPNCSLRACASRLHLVTATKQCDRFLQEPVRGNWGQSLAPLLCHARHRAITRRKPILTDEGTLQTVRSMYEVRLEERV